MRLESDQLVKVGGLIGASARTPLGPGTVVAVNNVSVRCEIEIRGPAEAPMAAGTPKTCDVGQTWPEEWGSRLRSLYRTGTRHCDSPHTEDDLTDVGATDGREEQWPCSPQPYDDTDVARTTINGPTHADRRHASAENELMAFQYRVEPTVIADDKQRAEMEGGLGSTGGTERMGMPERRVAEKGTDETSEVRASNRGQDGGRDSEQHAQSVHASGACPVSCRPELGRSDDDTSCGSSGLETAYSRGDCRGDQTRESCTYLWRVARAPIGF